MIELLNLREPTYAEADLEEWSLDKFERLREHGLEETTVTHPVIYGLVPVLMHMLLPVRDKTCERNKHTLSSVPKLTAST